MKRIPGAQSSALLLCRILPIRVRHLSEMFRFSTTVHLSLQNDQCCRVWDLGNPVSVTSWLSLCKAENDQDKRWLVRMSSIRGHH